MNLINFCIVLLIVLIFFAITYVYLVKNCIMPFALIHYNLTRNRHNKFNKNVAKEFIIEKINILRKKTYIELCKHYLDQHEYEQFTGKDGKEYYMQTSAFWDDKPDEVLRVWVDIHDEGWRSFFPMVECLLIDKDNNFIDE